MIVWETLRPAVSVPSIFSDAEPPDTLATVTVQVVSLPVPLLCDR